MKELPLPLVSVTIPCHNKAQTVKRTIDSVKLQTLNNLECFVVNDSSTDESKSIILEAIKDDRRFCYLEVNYRNVADTRNEGIRRSRGIYICTIDADDWIEDKFLEVCTTELIKDRTLGIAYTSLRAHNADGTSTISQWPGKFDPDAQLTYAKKQNQIPTANVFRREAWERAGGYKSRYCPYGAGSEDAALWSAICSIGYNAKMTESSATIQKLQGELTQKLNRKPSTEELEKFVNNPELWQQFQSQLFNYSASGGFVHGNREYAEVDWLEMYPWASDGKHPFASVATPKRHSHAVSQYDQPVISVIIPVGPGHETEVQNALDSLEMQHFRKWEAIVIHDGSGCVGWDCEGKGLQMFRSMKAYPYARQITIQPGQKGGAGRARNEGVKIARAPLLFYLDADDVLASPDALQKMLDAWNREQAIIYSEYLGKAIWNEAEARKVMGDNLLGYNTKQGTAIFKPKNVQGDYNCEVAQRQPEYGTGGTNMPYYNWTTVSVLIPKAWHNAIGGFDEDMPTWEDVDYHWRLARAGYCYYRIPEHLLLYNYHKGYRREASQVKDEEGRQKHKSLIQYIKHKYEDLKPVGCNCGGRRNNGATIASTQAVAMSDENFIMIEFDFPGSDTRSTFGKSLMSPTKQVGPGGKVLDYRGYARIKGDRFLVHIADQKARPDMFRIVPAEVVLPEVQKVELPEPQLIVAESRPELVEGKKRGRPAKVAA